jgi:hypothetical protein
MTVNEQPKKEEQVSEFKGYHAPTSNTTYTPNQFFDVVLRHSSRGAVRLVGYMIRKTLGWSDAQGNPQEPHVVISYRQLVEEAGISRGAIQPTIEEAIAANYIRCIRKGRSSGPGESAISALYELCWDESGEYVTAQKSFHGFFAGNGNLTYIPNQFFDYTVPNEPLAVVKIVGAIIRHTIGFQTKFGFRRQHIAMSFTSLQRTTGLVSRRALNDAIQYALQHCHVERVEEGVFDPAAGQMSKAATYAVKWCDSNAYPMTGSKRIPEDSEITSTGADERFKKDTGDRFKKDTGGSSKRIPAPVQKGYREQFKKDTDIEIKLINNISKQQQPAAVDEILHAFEKLKETGFDVNTAALLAGNYPAEEIARQIEWLPRRNPARNPLGMLRKSIEEGWPFSDDNPQSKSLGAIFATHFYAAWAGNEGEPASPATLSDITDAERFVRQLLQHYPDQTKVDKMGRSFGKFVCEQEAGNAKMPRSLRLALTRHGDEFVVNFRLKIKMSRKRAAQRMYSAHFTQYEADYFAYLQAREEELRSSDPGLYAPFEKDERSQRESLATSPFCSSDEFRKEMVDAFDKPLAHLRRFQEFFATPDNRILADFWTWDSTMNPNGLVGETART